MLSPYRQPHHVGGKHATIAFGFDAFLFGLHAVPCPTVARRNLPACVACLGDRRRAAAPDAGGAPRGYAILTPTRWINVFTAENRKFGTSVEEKAALWGTLVTYSGLYRIEGDRLITTVGVSWNERWNGTEQVRYWRLEGNRLSITTGRAPWSRDPSKMSVTRAVFEKVE